MKLVNLMELNILILLATICTPAFSQTSQIDPITSSVTTPRPDTGHVEPTPQEDKIITESIKGHIKKSVTLSKLKIDLHTNKGVVTFLGNADSDSQVSSLIELAQSIIGVKDVDASNIKIKESKQPLADMMLTAKIKGLFIREEIFGTKDIASINLSVESKDGIVYLTGVVDNQEQMKNAIKLIEGVKGVKKVEYNVTKATRVPADANTAPANK